MYIKSLIYEDQSTDWKLKKIEFNPLTLLVGVSGVGKTQILKALLNLKRISRGKSLNGLKWEVEFSTSTGHDGRITPGSFRKYRLARPLVGSMFARLHHVAAQDEEYARRFVDLGVPADRVSVTGTMKFDTAEITGEISGTGRLAAAVGLSTGVPLEFHGSDGYGYLEN